VLRLQEKKGNGKSPQRSRRVGGGEKRRLRKTLQGEKLKVGTSTWKYQSKGGRGGKRTNASKAGGINVSRRPWTKMGKKILVIEGYKTPGKGGARREGQHVFAVKANSPEGEKGTSGYRS